MLNVDLVDYPNHPSWMSMGYGSIPATLLLPWAVIAFVAAATSGTTQEYYWGTGVWGSCQHHDCGEGGTKTRIIFCNHKSGWATIHTHCEGIAKPVSSTSCFKICPKHNNQVMWSTTAWSKCTAPPTTCNYYAGVQARDVMCKWKATDRMASEDICEHFNPKPAMQQQCEVNCPQDCVLSTFTEWSLCATCDTINRTRTRTVIVPSANGGQACPALSEMDYCDECTNVFKYSVGQWSPCIQFDVKSNKTHPLIGHQKRDIYCLSASGSVVHLSWSAWEPVNNSCVAEDGSMRRGYMLRRRRVLNPPLGDGKPCDKLDDLFEVVGKMDSAVPCPRFHWVISAWGECQSLSSSAPCGQGTQQRNAICQERDHSGISRPVSADKCQGHQPSTNQPCQVRTCDVNCSVSDWSNWNECRAQHCDSGKLLRRANIQSGYRIRSRTLSMYSEDVGAPCPHIKEMQLCPPVPCYHWNVTTSRACNLYNVEEACGTGIRYVDVECIDVNGREVGDEYCMEYSVKPESEEVCVTTCPSDCVVSDWTVWSDCKRVCLASGTVATRRRTRRILAFPGKHGSPCPANKELTDTETCPAVEDCQTYFWHTTRWGRCEFPTHGQVCGNSHQIRQVSCYGLHMHQVYERKCVFDLRPTSRRPCEVPCKRDCIVTEYSDWFPCSATCWEAKQAFPTQVRHRFILQQQERGGDPCPIDFHEYRQCLHLPRCHKYYWDTGQWSDCVLPPRVPHCGIGLRGRGVRCKDEMNVTHTADVCLRFDGPMPAPSQHCHEICDNQCHMSDWSGFSHCIRGCDGYRFRKRELIGASKHNSKCRDIRKYQLFEKKKCFCDVLQPVVIGNWSECIVEDTLENQNYAKSRNQRDRSMLQFLNHKVHRQKLKRVIELLENESLTAHTQYCGVGKKYKAVTCTNDYHIVEMAEKCSNSEYEEEICIINCPVDCAMSAWSRWSACSQECGHGVQIRFRHTVTSDADGGRQCPKLDVSRKETQTKICYIHCEEYKWAMSAWSTCEPHSQWVCGVGIQTRHVQCTKVDKTGRVLVGADSHCIRLAKPEYRQNCRVQCAGDCVVSDWSRWSECDKPCSRQRTQMRMRRILRPASSCPSLEEQRPCIKGANCVEHMWEYSKWSSCLIGDGDFDCGYGQRARYAHCKSMGGLILENSICEQFLGAIPEPLAEQCEVTCDRACLLSDWSDWSSCSTSCGLGATTRKRQILQQAYGKGRVCPKSTIQGRPCFLKSCYVWKISEWTSCGNEKGVCGHAIQTRNITCMSEQDTVVESRRCPSDIAIAILPVRRACHVKCPGECILTPWSTWSDCFVSCQDFEADHKKGVRTRSRAILANPNYSNEKCPDVLYQSQPCIAPICYSFHWAATKWVENRREIWCQRSDGVNVSGGCDENSRPEDTLVCTVPCELKKSECVARDTCGCVPGYWGHEVNHVLVACIMDGENATFAPTELEARYLPKDGPTNFWMYAVIIAGTMFIIFAAIALYTMCEMFRTGPRRFGQHNKQASERAASTANRVPPSSREEETGLCNHVPHRTPTRSDDIMPDRLASVGGNPHVSEFDLDASHYTNSPIIGATAAVDLDDPAACIAQPRCSSACSYGEGAYSRVLPKPKRASFSSLRGSKHLSGDYGLAEVSAWIHSQLPDNLPDQDLDKTLPQETDAPPLILDANLSRTNGATWSEQDLSAEKSNDDQHGQKWSTKVSDQSTDDAGTGSCFSGSPESISPRNLSSRQASIETEENTDTSSVVGRNSLSSFSHDLKKPYVYIETSILDTPHLRVNRIKDSVKNSKYAPENSDRDYLNLSTVDSKQNSNLGKTDLELPRNMVNGASNLSGLDDELSLPYTYGELNNNHNTPKIDNLNNSNAGPSSDRTSINQPPLLHNVRNHLAFSDINGFPPPPELKDFNTPDEDYEASPLLNAILNLTPKLDDQTLSPAPVSINGHLKTIDIPDKLRRLSGAMDAPGDMNINECHSLLDHHDNPVVTSSCIS